MDVARGLWCRVGLAFVGVASAGCRPTAEEQVAVSARALATSANEAILGFEDPSAWTVTQGGLPPGTASANHTEGSFSLAVNPSGYGVLTSPPFAVLSALTGPISYDLYVPSAQANPYWFGATQLYLDCPPRNIYNAFIGQVELTGLEADSFHTMAFSISDPGTLAALDGGCVDLSFAIAINVPWNETTTFRSRPPEITSPRSAAASSLTISRRTTRGFRI
jgi:hypothetical protein